MYADRTHYREYQRMLVDLHAMIAAGDSDSDGAMDLREQMEGPEAHLSESEMARLNGLSGDLSMIHDREIPDPEVVASVLAGDLPRLIMEAYDRDWNELLTLLRADVSVFLKPEQVAYMRSRAYEALNELAPAVAFMDEAARRNPRNARYRALAIELLWKDQQYDHAYARAKACLADPLAPASLILMGGGVFSRLAQQSYPPADLPAIARIALDRVERAILTETSPAVRSAGQASLGLLALYVSEDLKATAALQAVLDEDDDITHFQTRGVLIRGLELVRSGQSKTAEARTLSRELADVFASS